MAWIPMIPEEDAEGVLKELYDRYTEPWGGVDNIAKIHSLNPASMRDHFALYRTVMRGRSPLSRIQREMIALVVSAVNQCHY